MYLHYISKYSSVRYRIYSNSKCYQRKSLLMQQMITDEFPVIDFQKNLQGFISYMSEMTGLIFL
jgi:hypothetical protein